MAQKVKDNALIKQFPISRSSISNRESNCDMFEITRQVLSTERKESMSLPLQLNFTTEMCN